MKYNFDKLVEMLKQLVGKEFEISVASNNGRQQLRDFEDKVIGVGKIHSTVHTHKGKLLGLKNYDENKFNIMIEMEGSMFPLFGIDENPVYQCGVCKIVCNEISNKPLYVNDEIVNYPDCFIFTANNVFDEATTKEMMKNFSGNPYKNKLDEEQLVK